MDIDNEEDHGSRSTERKKRFRLPHSDVLLDAVETRIIHTRQFQRLFNLRQLGLAYLVYPGATHTRGVHSIETLHQATLILKALRANRDKCSIGVSDEDYKAVRLAALLHDIGHIPFSHTLEDEHQVLSKHDGEKRVNKAFAMLIEELEPCDDEMRSRLDSAKEILINVSTDDDPIESRYVKDWRSDLVGNTICADLLAYINADAEWTGIEKRSGHYRIYEYFRIKREEVKKGTKTERVRHRLCVELTKNGVLRTDVVSAILDILDLRYALTERVLFHHAKCIASGMLARASRLCRLEDGDCDYLKEDKDKEPSRQRSLLRMGDESFLDFLEERAYGLKSPELSEDKKGALHLLRQLRSRNLYQRIFKVSVRTKEAVNDGRADPFSDRWRKKEEVEGLLSGIEDSLHLPKGVLVLWCSDRKAGKKLVRVNVTWDSDDCTNPVELRSEVVRDKFPTVHARVRAVEEQYQDLWCFWVGLDRRQLGKAGAVIKALENRLAVQCDKMFKETYLRRVLNISEERERMEGYLAELTIPLIQETAGRLESGGALPALDGNDESSLREAAMVTFFQVAEERKSEMIPQVSRGKKATRPKPSAEEQLSIIPSTTNE